MRAARQIVFLCSGGGANMRFIHQAIQQGWLQDCVLRAIITDRQCAANTYAAAQGIKAHCLDFQQDGHEALEQLLEQLAPDVVVTNIHRILRPSLVAKFRGKLINLHYSLLPAFGGSIGEKPVKDAILYGAQFTGVTVHHVTESVDAGAPIVQVAIPLGSGEAFNDRLMDVVFRSGCLALLTALRGAQADSQLVTLHGKPCYFSALTGVVPEEAFWNTLQAPVL